VAQVSKRLNINVKIIQRTNDTVPALLKNMGINHGGGNIVLLPDLLKTTKSCAIHPPDLRGISFDEIKYIVLSNRNKFFPYEWNSGEVVSHLELHPIFCDLFALTYQP